MFLLETHSFVLSSILNIISNWLTLGHTKMTSVCSPLKTFPKKIEVDISFFVPSWIAAHQAYLSFTISEFAQTHVH